MVSLSLARCQKKFKVLPFYKLRGISGTFRIISAQPLEGMRFESSSAAASATCSKTWDGGGFAAANVSFR